MSKRDRLVQRIKETEARWQRLAARLRKLQLARDLETRSEERERMDNVIHDAEQDLAAVDAEQRALDAQLAALQQNERESGTEPGRRLLFWSQAPADELLGAALRHCLDTLPAANAMQHFFSSNFVPGAETQQLREQALDRSRLILLLLSADYLADDLLYEYELKPALKRHDAGLSIVIPILVRACAWTELPVAKLQVLPKGGVPIYSWPDRELALQAVAEQIEKAAAQLSF